MQVPSATHAAYSGTHQPSAAEVAQTDNAFAQLFADENESPEDTLKEITSHGVAGMLKWQIDELRKKITAQVMGQHHLTRDAISKMDATDRIAIEKQIMDEVAQKLKLAIREEMKKHNGLLASFDPLTQQAMISAQEVGS